MRSRKSVPIALWKRCGSGEASTSMPKAGAGLPPVPAAAAVVSRSGMSASDKAVAGSSSPYIFRAYYSLPGTIRDPNGVKVSAVYGFASFLLKLIADEKVTHLGVAFDRNLNGSFRNRFYPPYKEQRQAPPADLVATVELEA